MLPADPSVKPPFFAVILPPVTRNIKRVERYDRRVKQKLSQFKDVHRPAVTNHGSLDPQQLLLFSNKVQNSKVTASCFCEGYQHTSSLNTATFLI